ncbi:DUF960 family protein [Cohnella hongkongensis]|uniref:DUF960 family protein n=1 Tax=Cohnella hongkongensis TaxID=178337 RepID=A0ABV9F9J3_9BACL
MFTGRKIVSKQVQEEIPSWLQNLLWYMVETMDVPQKDRTQFFELKGIVQNGTFQQKIVQQQQNPYYRKEQILTLKRTYTAKVIVVDNVSECFMLILSS